MNKYENFWSWFVDNAPGLHVAIKGNGKDSAVQRLNNAIDAVDTRLAWEIGPGKNLNWLALTISAEGDPELRAVVDTLFKYRPAIDGWEIYPYRQRKEPATLQDLLRSQGRAVDFEKCRIGLALTISRERVDVAFRASDFRNIPNDDRIATAFFVLDGLLGEELVEKRIGRVEILQRLDEAKIALLDLRSFLDELLSR